MSARTPTAPGGHHPPHASRSRMAKVAERDLLPRARAPGRKLCIRRATNSQCAPCKRSDKLVIRMRIMPGPGRCIHDDTARTVR